MFFSNKNINSLFLLKILLASVVCFSFLKQAFPFPYPIQHFLFFLLLITYFHYCFVYKSSRLYEPVVRVPSKVRFHFFLILIINLFIYIFSFAFNQEWPAIVKQETLFAFFSIIFTWVIFTVQINVVNLASLIAWLCVVIGGGIACLGLYKFFLILNGEVLFFVLKFSSDVYPQGTSLVSDYNFFSLSLLISAIACLSLSKTKLSKLQEFVLGAAFIILIFSAFLSGSRRLWILGPLCLFLVYLTLNKNNKYIENSIFKKTLLIISSLTVLLVFNYLNFVELEAFLSLWQRIQSLGSFESFSGRSDRWNYVFEILDLKVFLFGMGAEYLYEYERKFTLGTALDYPHNPIYSALLYSGVIGAIAAAYFYFFALKISMQLVRLSHPIGCFLAVSIFSQVIYSIISANSVFSIFLMLNFLALAVALMASADLESPKSEVNEGN